ncbi:MAG: inositol-3-phosphate synthase, partial [Nitrospirota bacterium]|nr:inositol-3-phosphate synthase [Nitrospirota bacterium]
MKGKIRIAIAGIGNCASSLIQGIEYYKGLGDRHPDKSLGLMHYDLGGYKPADIEIVAAFDIDKRKVGRPLKEAVFAEPNCTKVFNKKLYNYPVTVQ